ncbi:MAG: hypothetical protein GXP29_08240 [Planctomycetes bacterium]|nr:hypothetical protein [Planctomycetota bacterium]
MTLDELRRDLGDAAFDDLCAGVACEAEHDANLLADALDRVAPSGKRKTASREKPSFGVVQATALLAMLPRIQRWHDGDVRYFAKPPPDPAVVIDLLARLGQGPMKNEDVDDMTSNTPFRILQIP